MKCLAVIKHTDGKLSALIFDSIEEMEVYVENTYIPFVEKVLLTMLFAAD